MMTVTLATPSLARAAGGPAYSVSAIGRNLQAHGLTVRFSVLRGHAPGDSWSTLLRPFEADLVHSFGLWSPVNHWAAISSRLARRPLVVSPLGMLEPWCLANHGARKRMGMFLYQRRDLERANVLHVTSEAEGENVRGVGIKTPLALIPHGVEIPEALPARARRSGGPRTALFLSRLHPKKGLLELIQAWAALRPSEWRVVIAGPDESGYRAVLERAVAKHGLEQAFRFTGPLYGADKTQLLLSSDLFVLPTHSENFGHVIPEAAAHGLPVLTTTAAPWKELVESESGFWIEPGTDSLIAGLRIALERSEAELTAMGARGREMVKARYGWNATIKKHLAVYQSIVHGSSWPAFVST